MNPVHPSEFAAIVMVVTVLSMTTLMWMWQTDWGQSAIVFYGVRVPERFEDSLDAMPIRNEYERIVKLIPVVLSVFYGLLLHLGLMPNVIRSEAVLYGIALVQAVAVRMAFWRARNQTLAFAAVQDTVRKASFSELASPGLTWQVFYWTAVLLPLFVICYTAGYIWTNWLALHLPVATNARFPLTVDSPALAWTRVDVLLSMRWVGDPLLANLVAVIVAFAFNFRSRINEWGEEQGERRSYRRQLMVFAVVMQWIAVFNLVFTVYSERMMASTRFDFTTTWHFLLMGLLPMIAIDGLLPLWLLYRLYENRPPGFISKSDEQHWKFGLYYVNQEDAAAVVPSRFGVGQTFNLAHPMVWAILGLSAAALLLRFMPVVLPARVSASTSVAGDFVTERYRAAFLSDAEALQYGEFAASERLLSLAGNIYNPDLWSSIAFVLAQNNVKPTASYKLAASAVTMAEVQTRSSVTPSSMAHLAAMWSNLGYVCLQHPHPDTGCAYRYLLAAETLDPHESYAKLLAKAQVDDASHAIAPMQTAMSLTGAPVGTTPIDIELTSRGDAKVNFGDGAIDSRVDRAIAGALHFPWPDGSTVHVRLRAELQCSAAGDCSLTVLRPGV